MTWKYIDKVPVEEAAEFMHLTLYAAIDGFDGCSPEELEKEDLKRYWDGCIATVTRTLAFVFAGTESSWNTEDGIYIGDSADSLDPILWKAVQALVTRREDLPSGLDEYDLAERAVVDAADVWAKGWLNGGYAERLILVMRKQCEERILKRINRRIG